MNNKILVVEDSHDTSNALKILFEYNKFSVIQCFESQQALDIAKQSKPGLIILDFMMPGLSGKDVLVMLKQDPKTKDIPVIMLTAKTDALKTNAALKACDKFMTKPFDNKEVLKEAKKLLSR
ncbi:response regulator [Candidatus Woesearchaeota archaeon]|nr:response regulator [Candidatus Woesearchaeota archaeon]